jgi:polar amino acid transport system substrate-binding protein
MSSPQLIATRPRHAQRRVARALFALLAMLGGGSTRAVEPPTLHLVFEDYPPYEFLDQGQPTGIHVSLLREVAERLNIRLRLESLPWLRAIDLAEHGEVDGIFSLFRTAERERFLVFPEQPLSLETNVLLTSARRPVAVARRDDLRGLSVGVVAGNAYGAWFDSADWIDRQPVTGSERLLLKQADARTDVSVSNVSVARFLIERLQLQEQILVLDFVISEEPLYVAFPRARGEASQRLASQFGAALRELREAGRSEHPEANRLP